MPSNDSARPDSEKEAVPTGLQGLVHLLASHSTLQQIASNSGWLIAERIVNMSLRFAASVWVVRYLGPEDYGTLWYAVSITSLVMAVATLGLDAVVIRALSRNPDDERRIMRTAWRLRLVSGTVATVAVVALAFSLAPDPLTRTAIILASVQLFFQASNVGVLWFQAKIQSKYAAWVRSGVNVLFVAAQVLLILTEASVLAFVGALSAQVALQTIGITLVYLWARDSGESDRPRVRFDAELAWSMFRDAWPLMVASLSVAVYLRVDQVMLGLWLDNKAVGVYATAVKLSELWYILPTIIATSLYPKLAQVAVNADPARYRVAMQVLFDGMALLAYVVIVPILLGADGLVHLLFGAEYAASTAVVKVHILAFLFFCLGTARDRWLEAENLTRFAMIAALVGAIINVLLNLLLIPRAGVLGAAWATVGSYAIASYITGMASANVRPVFGQMTRAILAPFRLPSILRQTRRILSRE